MRMYSRADPCVQTEWQPKHPYVRVAYGALVTKLSQSIKGTLSSVVASTLMDLHRCKTAFPPLRRWISSSQHPRGPRQQRKAGRGSNRSRRGVSRHDS